MNQNLFFAPTDILLPERADMHRWSVIACECVPHPSMGGANAFKKAVAELFAAQGGEK